MAYSDFPRGLYGIKETFREEDDPAKRNQKDNAYEALMQVTNCISAEAREWESYNNLTSCVFMIPLVILDGRLFECYLDNTNEVIVSEIKASTVLWPMKKTHGIFSTPVTVLTTDSLPSFVQKANEAAATLFSYEPLIQKIRQQGSTDRRKSTYHSNTGQPAVNTGVSRFRLDIEW
jgi:hypothetical protein